MAELLRLRLGVRGGASSLGRRTVDLRRALLDHMDQLVAQQRVSLAAALGARCEVDVLAEGHRGGAAIEGDSVSAVDSYAAEVRAELATEALRKAGVEGLAPGLLLRSRAIFRHEPPGEAISRTRLPPRVRAASALGEGCVKVPGPRAALALGERSAEGAGLGRRVGD